MKNIAIIPARGGSKRIPKKNIKIFNNKPVIHYPIKAAFESQIFEEIMVSTDSEEIAGVAKEMGAQLPFMRSVENSNDHATINDVIFEVLYEYEKRGQKFDHFCCLLPTAIFITRNSILDAFNLLKTQDYDSVFPVVRYSFPIQRSLKVEQNKISIVFPDTYKMRSQDLEPRYHDSGQFYIMKTDLFKSKKKILTDNTGAIEIPESSVQDIDTEEDWKIAEMKYSLLLDNV